MLARRAVIWRLEQGRSVSALPQAHGFVTPMCADQGWNSQSQTKNHVRWFGHSDAQQVSDLLSRIPRLKRVLDPARS